MNIFITLLENVKKSCTSAGRFSLNINHDTSNLEHVALTLKKENSAERDASP
jgi:hypothetical protein